MKTLISNLDIFNNEDITFTTSKNYKRTVFGGICSIILFFAFILLYYRLCIKFFDKKEPVLTFEDQIISETTNTTITNENFPLIFALTTEDEDIITFNEDFIYLTFKYTIYDYFSEEKYKEHYLKPYKCGDDYISYVSKEQQGMKETIPISLCIDIKDSPIYGNYNSMKMSYYSVLVNYCKPGFTHRITNLPCPDYTEEELNAKIAIELQKYYYFNLAYPSYFIDKENIDLPFPYYFNILSALPFYKNQYTTKKLTLELSEMQSKNLNLFSSDIVYNHAVSISESGIVYGDPETEDSLYAINFTQSHYRRLYTREYMSLEMFMGNMGGIFQIIMLVVNAIIGLYSNNCFYLNIHELYKRGDVRFIDNCFHKNQAASDNLTKMPLANIKQLGTLRNNIDNNIIVSDSKLKANSNKKIIFINNKFDNISSNNRSLGDNESCNRLNDKNNDLTRLLIKRIKQEWKIRKEIKISIILIII